MRYALLLPLVFALAACEDDVLPTKPKLAPRKAAVNAAVVAMPKVDTTKKTSSICRASVRAGSRASVQVSESPDDFKARKRAVAYAALISDACQ